MPRPSRQPPSDPQSPSPEKTSREKRHGSGRRIGGRYELHEIAGRGGMAVVWRGTQHGDVGFSRTVALKQMHDHLADSQIYVDMFAEEARVLATVASPNIAAVYDFVNEDGQYYLVQEWIDGIDLGSYIHYYFADDSRTRWDLVTAIGIGVMRALAAAHERRDPDGKIVPVVHRDVSPHNILVTGDGMVKLIDFGLSLAVDRGKELTDPGIVKGKMSYLSPEIVGGQRPSPLSDQFAAGSVLWEALVGHKLFDGQNDYEIYKKLRDGHVAPLRPLRRDVPRELAAVIHRALAVDESKRFESAREMANHLVDVLRSHRAPRDLQDLLGESAREAREGMSRLQRTLEPSSSATPLADLEQGSPITLDRIKRPRPETGSEDTPARAERARTARETASADPAAKKGLLHKIPLFLRRFAGMEDS
ncbi:MAG TPA: serine/threonine-protein kinase [Kofleriaceae bacterium]|nr:serine/threonine-protein kinase [Kofleriaceae bacterium]